MATITGPKGSCKIIPDSGRPGRYDYECQLDSGKEGWGYNLTKSEATSAANKAVGAGGSSKSSKKHISEEMDPIDWPKVGLAGAVVVGGIFIFRKLSGK